MSAPGGCAQRELAETVGVPLDGGRLAHALFAHGLLVAQAEARAPGAAAATEARVQRVMAAIGSGAALASPEPIDFDAHRARPVWLRWLPAAAAVLVVGLTLALLVTRPRQPVYAEIIARTLQETADGVHLYKVRLAEKRVLGRQTPAGPRAVERSSASTWLAALAPERRWVVRKLEGDRWLLDGTEIGSDGKTMWMRSRTGQAFDLTLDPRAVETASLDPVLHFYQLLPFLRALFSELEGRVVGREEGPSGTLIHLAGTYAYDASHERLAMSAYRRSFRSFVLGSQGRLTITVDESNGHLVHLRLEQLAPRVRTFEIERQPTPDDLGAAGFDFDPPRVRTSPQVKLLVWIHQAIRTWNEKKQAKAGR